MEGLKVYKHNHPSLKDLFNLSEDTTFIAGPCAIETEDLLDCVAKCLVENQVKFMRGGAYKPRTSPYDFQGLGLDGLKMAKEIADKHKLYFVSEILDPRDVEKAIDYVDIIQIGSRNMQNYSLLKEVGKTNKPIILKRGMMATIQEFLYAAEYIINEGNLNVIMCERGIRTFENYTRNTLDITCIAILKSKTTLPVIVDISHAAGRTDIIPTLTKYLYQMDIDGIMLEVHPYPKLSCSDSQQTLSLKEFENLLKSLNRS